MKLNLKKNLSLNRRQKFKQQILEKCIKLINNLILESNHVSSCLLGCVDVLQHQYDDDDDNN